MNGNSEKWVWGLVGVGLGTAIGYWWVKRQQQAGLLPASTPVMLPAPQTGQEAAGAVGEFPQGLRKMQVTPGYASDAVPEQAAGEQYAVDEFAEESDGGEF